MKKIGFLVITACIVGSFILGLTTVAAKTSFKDVSSSFWAEKEIDYLYDKKIINGYPDGEFGPNDTIKRIDAATMIVRALDLDTSNPSNPRFDDVTKESKGFNTIATVVDEGIFTGRDGKFYPNETLTRAEMAAIINRAYELEKKNKKVSFKDVPSKHWGYKDIQALVAHNITTGFPDNTFRPSEPTTRAEFSAFMTRVIKGIDEISDSKDEDSKDKDEAEDNDSKNEDSNDEFEVIDII